MMGVFLACIHVLTGQAAEPEFLEAVPSCTPHQAAEAGLHDPHPAVDLCSVLQGAHTHHRMLINMTKQRFKVYYHPHSGFT